MKNIKFVALFLFALTLTSNVFAAYHLVSQIPIKGQGGWDYLSIEPKSHRLFVSHADRVVVIDTEKNQVIKEITDTPGIHGIAIAADLNKAFSSHGKEQMVGVIDLDKLTMKTKIKVGENPDAIAYEPLTHEIYAFNGKSHTASIIDAKTEKVVATIALPGKPEFAAVDASEHRIFVNIEDKNSILAINTQNHKIVNTWPLEGCESPSGLAIDIKTHHLFSVCENEKMVMVDSKTGHVISSVTTGQGTDAADFDPSLNLAFSSNGKSGTITTIQEGEDKLTLVQNVKSQVGARTMILNPLDHHIYLTTADFKPGETGERPKPIDGTQRVLVFAP